MVSNPSVTLGSNPTLSLNITGGTTSRIAMGCHMGIYVDYTPAAGPPPEPLPQPLLNLSRLNAIHRAASR